MAVYHVKLTSKQTVATNTMAFHFEKPVGFYFEPGQYADYILINPTETDSKGNDRSFTIASAPFENEIVFITRMRDTAFKRVMRDMQIGSEIMLDGPNGNFVLKQNDEPVVFVTGGVGVTPVLSIIKQQTHDQNSQKIVLFYSNKTVDSAVYIDELYKLAKLNSNFIFIPTISEQADANYSGETGRIDGDMLRRYLSDLSKPHYYISGPPTMVKSLRQILLDNKVKIRKIITEDFSGYN